MKAMEWLGKWVGYLFVFTFIVSILAVAKWAVIYLVGAV
jgi:hypothetical protein